MRPLSSAGLTDVSIGIFDHPKNSTFPTYWHNRGYGLFAANPFGAKEFTKGKTTLNFTIQPGKSETFRFRMDSVMLRINPSSTAPYAINIYDLVYGQTPPTPVANTSTTFPRWLDAPFGCSST